MGNTSQSSVLQFANCPLRFKNFKLLLQGIRIARGGWSNDVDWIRRSANGPFSIDQTWSFDSKSINSHSSLRTYRSFGDSKSWQACRLLQRSLHSRDALAGGSPKSLDNFIKHNVGGYFYLILPRLFSKFSTHSIPLDFLSYTIWPWRPASNLSKQ